MYVSVCVRVCVNVCVCSSYIMKLNWQKLKGTFNAYFRQLAWPVTYIGPYNSIAASSAGSRQRRRYSYRTGSLEFSQCIYNYRL